MATLKKPKQYEGPVFLPVLLAFLLFGLLVGTLVLGNLEVWGEIFERID